MERSAASFAPTWIITNWWRPQGYYDQSAVIGDAIPGFILAIILVTIFGIQLGFFPAISTISLGAGADAWIASMTERVIALTINAVTSGAQQIRSAVINSSRRTMSTPSAAGTSPNARSSSDMFSAVRHLPVSPSSV